MAYITIDADSRALRAAISDIEHSIQPAALADWMESDVAPFFQDKILDRFASAPWMPLAEATIRIRHAMGQTDDYAINDRTGEMLEVLTSQYDIDIVGSDVQISIPGEGVDGIVEDKIQVAQEGRTWFNPLFNKVTTTPPRPVLVVSGSDDQALTQMLRARIMRRKG